MFTFGSDPELMLFLNGTPHSAIGVVSGSIENRIYQNGHEFYYDNVLAECAIAPGSCKDEVIHNFRDCLQIYANMVKPYQLIPQASVIFNESELNHPDARRVGCAKDFCAYTMQQKNGPVDQITRGNLRSCGGHIHLGHDVLTQDGAEPILAVYLLDLFVGVPSLWLDKDPTSPKRRSIYGKAGRYRVKSYGIEYRSLSNFWLESPEMVELIYDLSYFAIKFVESDKGWELWNFDIEKFLDSDNLADAWECKAYDPIALQEGISQTDKTKVAKHLELVQSLLPKKLKKNLEKLINRRVEKTMYENWGII
ncbi:MAG: hypothetical protein WCJ72_19890 [Chryseobacterium sp.]